MMQLVMHLANDAWIAVVAAADIAPQRASDAKSHANFRAQRGQADFETTTCDAVPFTHRMRNLASPTWVAAAALAAV